MQGITAERRRIARSGHARRQRGKMLAGVRGIGGHAGGPDLRGLVQMAATPQFAVAHIQGMPRTQ